MFSGPFTLSSKKLLRHLNPSYISEGSRNGISLNTGVKLSVVNVISDVGDAGFFNSGYRLILGYLLCINSIAFIDRSGSIFAHHQNQPGLTPSSASSSRLVIGCSPKA
jgi:hypothetical protein